MSNVCHSDCVDSCFICAQPGDVVVVKEEELGFNTRSKQSATWWLGTVLFAVGGARNPFANSVFQVIDVDTGIVRTINADLVKNILIKRSDSH